MSKTANEIKEKIRAMTANVVQCMIGTVISIDEDNAVCDVEVDGNTYYDVHLKSVMDENVKGIKILPAKDSIVLVEQVVIAMNYLWRCTVRWMLFFGK